VEAVWLIDAVLETASIRSPVVIEPEGLKTLRSGCLDEGTRSMHQASSCSAERDAVAARHAGKVGSRGSRGSQTGASPLSAATEVLRKEFRWQAPRTLQEPVAGKPLEQSRYASSSAGSRLGLPGKALPNPSLKPSPNGKPPGPACGALHSPQPGPGAFPLVPA